MFASLVFVHQFYEDHLIIMGLEESVPVGAEMACEANPRSKGSGTVWTVDGGCCRRLKGSAFPVLAALLSCRNPFGFMGLCATANRCPTLCSLHSCLLPRVVADAEGFQ